MSVFIDRAKDDARGKVKPIRVENDGFDAYFLLNQWYTKVSDARLQGREREREQSPDTG